MEISENIVLCSNKASGLLWWFIPICRLIVAICDVLLSSTSPSPPSSFLFIQTLMACLSWKLLTTICQLKKNDQYYCIHK